MNDAKPLSYLLHPTQSAYPLMCARTHAHMCTIFPSITRLYSESITEKLQKKARNSTYKLSVPTPATMMVEIW